MTDIVRDYTEKDVKKLRGSFKPSFDLAVRTSEKLRMLLSTNKYTHALGAMTGCQAIQMVKAGLKTIYCSGWQVAADANSSGEMYPDQSLYPVDSVPKLVSSINSSLTRADEIDWLQNGMKSSRDWYAPIVADAEAGFGGTLNVFELTKALIKAGVAGIHLEDQLSSAKKCGHLGGKVLVPRSEFIRKLKSARLATDVLRVPTVIIARTDAHSATLLTSDIDKEDEPFLENNARRTLEGFYKIRNGLELAIDRSLSYAPYADMLWFETSQPDLQEAKVFAEAIHARYPGKWLAYNCSPSFNWKSKLADDEIYTFQKQLGDLGYRFQFITLAGFHSLNHSMYSLASDYKKVDMSAYAEFQHTEFLTSGYTAVKHQAEVGTGYFDAVSNTISENSTNALVGSTEESQFGPSQL